MSLARLPSSPPHDAPALDVGRVRPKTIERTSPGVQRSRMAPHRLEAAIVACTIYAEAIEAAGATRGEVARALSVDESAIRHLCDPTRSAPITLRDVLAGPKRVRVAIAHALLALERPRLGLPPQHHALLCAEMIGAVCSVIREATAPASPGGERLTREERKQVKAAIERARAQLDALERDVDQDENEEER